MQTRNHVPGERGERTNGAPHRCLSRRAGLLALAALLLVSACGGGDDEDEAEDEAEEDD